MSKDVEIVIGAQDQASSVLAKVGSGISQLQVGMKSLAPIAVGAAGALASATAAVVAFNAASEVVLARAKDIDALAKAARNVGESVAGLQAFQFALGETVGLDSGSATKLLDELRKSVGDALQGDKGKIDILAQLGLDAQSLSNAGPVKAFQEVQAAIAKIENASQRAAIAQKLLGGEANAIMALLSDQSDAFAQSMQAAQDLGLTISDAGAAGVEAMNDSLARASAILDGVISQVTVELAPAIKIAADSATELMVSFGGVDLRTLVDDIVVIAGYTKDAANAAMQWADFVNANATFGLMGDFDFDVQFDSASKLLDQLNKNRADAANAAIKARQQREAEAAALARQVSQEDTAPAEAKTTEAEKTLAALEKQLAILKQGREEYERQAQLATATTDEERAKIVALQGQIAARQELDEKIKQAEIEKKRQDDALARAQTGVTATEGRLITRGNAGTDQKKALQTAESSLEELKRIREYLAQSDRAPSIEFVDVGGV